MERDKRFSQTGVNSAGDRVYSRNYAGDVASTSDDYDSMKVDELKALLSHMALPVSGTKAELIERLRDNG